MFIKYTIYKAHNNIENIRGPKLIGTSYKSRELDELK